MIRFVSSALTAWLVREKAILTEDTQLYAYAVYSLIWGLLPVIISLLLGMLFGLVIESLVLVLPFILLRKFSGGFHLKSPALCLFCSTALLSGALMAIKELLTIPNPTLLTLFVLLAVLSLWLHSPISSVEKKLSCKEIRVFRMVARSIAFFCLTGYILLTFTQQFTISVPLGIGTILTAILQMPCILKQQIQHLCIGQ